jgi:hypothetical protein
VGAKVAAAATSESPRVMIFDFSRGRRGDAIGRIFIQAHHSLKEKSHVMVVPFQETNTRIRTSGRRESQALKLGSWK